MRKLLQKKSLWFVASLLCMLAAIIIFNKTKPLPDGVSFESDTYYTDEITFLSDLTFHTNDEKLAIEQEIFHEVFDLIEDAEEFIVVDMFLFNDYTDQDRDFPDLSGQLTDALIQQKETFPNMQIVFITDPINTGYHSYQSPHIEKLEENEIEVVLTSLSELRDSNAAYSSAWRLFFQAFGQQGTGWVTNPFANEAPNMTVRSYLKLMNIKANHRKVVSSEKQAIITSANPHNESGFASNIAFKVSGEIIEDIVTAEQAVIDYSGGKTIINHEGKIEPRKGDNAVQYITEGKIFKHIIDEIEDAGKGDTIWLGMFYIANRSVIDALYQATDRGAHVKMILDPNKDAFGNNKTGLPNLPVAAEMIKNEDLDIRWYVTDEDQYHTKLLYIQKKDEGIIIGGSANYTTRNLNNLNLESDLKITAPLDAEIIQDVDQYFHRLWNNEDGLFTSDYTSNENLLTPALRFTYWVQKITDLTTY